MERGPKTLIWPASNADAIADAPVADIEVVTTGTVGNAEGPIPDPSAAPLVVFFRGRPRLIQAAWQIV